MNINKRLYWKFSTPDGFTLFEVIVVIFVIGILGVVALDRYYKLLVDVERTSMEHDLGVMRSAISMQVANFYIQGDSASLKALIGSNPIDLLKDKPDNYVGRFSVAEVEKIAPGSWFFDPQQGVLNYLVRNQLYFKSDMDGPGMAQFRIESGDSNSQRMKCSSIWGLQLNPLISYRWLSPWN